MINIFKISANKNTSSTEDDIRKEIQLRSEINSEARKMISKSKKESINNFSLKTLDEILDKVSGYENSKITAITELYLALESGNTKNLINFLKKKDLIVKKSKKTWEL